MPITINGVTVKQEVWLAAIKEPCTLGLDVLKQLCATVDTAVKRLLISHGANTVQVSNSLATVIALPQLVTRLGFIVPFRVLKWLATGRSHEKFWSDSGK